MSPSCVAASSENTTSTTTTTTEATTTTTTAATNTTTAATTTTTASTTTEAVTAPSSCTSTGKYPAASCNQYYECSAFLWWYNLELKTCASGTAYDSATEECVTDSSCS
ncbi:hypothetical protein NQ318_017580 [Aromia moschata]|uniref:Chitin-binding type-2 domain-containing protein n=1 Tax=Aromia moschata TaxID=1265417 RepID=A0AAV8Z230_9CUCU|nr:hypothetical protein NQ318_017580 [Aromia moschata]